MRHFSFDYLTFAQFEPIEVIGGSRPRLVLKNEKTNQRYFLKSYRHNTREVWAEMLASQLGEQVGLDIQAVSLKKMPKDLEQIFHRYYEDYLPDDWVPIGALVRNVFPKNHEILYGAQFIGSASDPVTLEEIATAIRTNYLDSEDLLQSFADMIVFDAWIGNMDRHHENWAIAQRSGSVQASLFPLTRAERESIKKLRRFTPLFDHGSSLLFELSDEDVDKYLNNRKLFVESYILGKKYALILRQDGTRANIYECIEEQIARNSAWGKRFKKSIQKIISTNSLVCARLVLQMPTDGALAYSEKRKKLLYYSLEERKKILAAMIGGA